MFCLTWNRCLHFFGSTPSSINTKEPRHKHVLSSFIHSFIHAVSTHVCFVVCAGTLNAMGSPNSTPALGPHSLTGGAAPHPQPVSGSLQSESTSSTRPCTTWI